MKIIKILKRRPQDLGEIILLAAIFWFYPQVQAATNLTVSSYADNLNNPFTLRTAINNAQLGDTITFETNLAGFTIMLLNGELMINTDLIISNWPGPTLGIVNENGRVFNIGGGHSLKLSGLRLRGKLVGSDGNPGNANASDGQAGYNYYALGTGAGGCIINWGELTVNNCFFEGSQARAGNGGDAFNGLNVLGRGGNGGSANGGAIWSLRNLALYSCTFSNNSAWGGNGGRSNAGVRGGDGGAALGGAVYCDYQGELTMKNCTFFANYALGGDGGAGGSAYIDFQQANPSPGGPGGDGGYAYGGAVYVYNGCDPGSCPGIVHCTITEDVCSPGRGGAGGAGSFGGPDGAVGSTGAAKGCGAYFRSPAPIRSTILAGNYAAGTIVPVGPDAWGAVFSTGFNLVGTDDGASGPWVNSDLRRVAPDSLDARLGPLQDNGGGTPTMAPLAGSPAIDAGNMDGVPVDQIGQPRPKVISGIVNGGDGSDIGAFELQTLPAGSPVVVTITNTATNTVVIFWPAPSTGFVLQENADLGVSNWVDTTYSVTVSGGQNQVIAPILDRRFFRLFHP